MIQVSVSCKLKNKNKQSSLPVSFIPPPLPILSPFSTMGIGEPSEQGGLSCLVQMNVHSLHIDSVTTYLIYIFDSHLIYITAKLTSTVEQSPNQCAESVQQRKPIHLPKMDKIDKYWPQLIKRFCQVSLCQPMVRLRITRTQGNIKITAFFCEGISFSRWNNSYVQTNTLSIVHQPMARLNITRTQRNVKVTTLRKKYSRLNYKVYSH